MRKKKKERQTRYEVVNICCLKIYASVKYVLFLLRIVQCSVSFYFYVSIIHHSWYLFKNNNFVKT